MVTQSPTMWLNKISSLVTILFFGITPIVLLFGILGGISLFAARKTDMARQLVWYFIIAFILQFVFARSINSRYVVPFLGIVSIFVLYGLSKIEKKVLSYFRFGAVFILFVLPVVFSGLLLIKPRLYLQSIPLEDNKSYLYGQTSGYGISDAVSFLESRIGEGRATIGVALQTGNPESSVIMNFEKNNKVHAAYFDSQSLGSLNSFDCLTVDHPVYFVSRNEELVGLDKFFN